MTGSAQRGHTVTPPSSTSTPVPPRPRTTPPPFPPPTVPAGRPRSPLALLLATCLLLILVLSDVLVWGICTGSFSSLDCLLPGLRPVAQAARVGGIAYVTYLLPGALVLTATASAAATTNATFAGHRAIGALDPYHPLPPATPSTRPSTRTGRAFPNALRRMPTVALRLVPTVALRLVPPVALVAIAGYALELRVRTGPLPALAALGLAAGFGIAIHCVLLSIALATRNIEYSRTTGRGLMLLTAIASPALVPIASLPGWLQLLARVNPASHAVEASRALLVGGPTLRPLLGSLAWIVILVGVFGPISSGYPSGTDRRRGSQTSP